MTSKDSFDVDPDRHPNGVMITGAAVITLINNGAEEVSMRIDGNNRQIILYNSEGRQSIAILGFDGTILNNGDLKIGPLLGGARTFEFYGTGQARGTGSFSVNYYGGPRSGSKRCLHFEGYSALMTVGMEKQIRIDGARSKISMGTNDQIVIDGAAGDILFKNADCAEEFRTMNDEKIDPGTVVVLGSSRRVKPCCTAFDTKVIGIVSGAGDLKPGIVLGKTQAPYAVPVALLGSVFCKTTTENGPVAEGDLLTTSSVKGHAMRVGDLNKYAGTIIGKALGELKEGSDIIPVLVTLR